MLAWRYSILIFAVLLTLTCAALAGAGAINGGWVAVPLLVAGLGLRDLWQTRHSVLRNYPVIGHFRFLIEAIRPEVRQYLLESDTDAQPFSRAQRSIVYQRSKNELDSLAFGTKLDVMANGHEWISHSLAPTRIESSNFRVLVGEESAQPYSMSVLNISAMSFGALSANAIRALNRGASLGGFAHDTGEGSISPYHREHGGDIVWEIGSGYFGCRTATGAFDARAFEAVSREPQVKLIEIKLSQGAKPGHGGVLPAAKVTIEIATTRGIATGEDCVSPASHSEFATPIELLEFVKRLRDLSGGKPTGFKLCIGHPWEFFGIAKAMLHTNILPDFIVVDGAEGGTGAAPLEFADHVGTPLQEGLLLVHNTLVGIGLRHRIRIGASGKIVTAFDIARTLAIGADWVNSARGFMFAVGCIQAQACNTGRCPTGVATQDQTRQKALDVPDKGDRVSNFHRHTLDAVRELLQAAGLERPAQLRAHHIVRRVSPHEVHFLSDLLGYLDDGDLLEQRLRFPVFQNFWPIASPFAFNPAGARPTPKSPARGKARPDEIDLQTLPAPARMAAESA